MLLVDLGGTRLKTGRWQDGQLVETQAQPSPTSLPGLLGELAARRPGRWALALPGLLDDPARTWLRATLPFAVKDMPLADLAAQCVQMGLPSPVLVTNDTTATAWALAQRGPAQALVLQISTGLAVRRLVDGQVVDHRPLLRDGQWGSPASSLRELPLPIDGVTRSAQAWLAAPALAARLPAELAEQDWRAWAASGHPEVLRAARAARMWVEAVSAQLPDAQRLWLTGGGWAALAELVGTFDRRAVWPEDWSWLSLQGLAHRGAEPPPS